MLEKERVLLDDLEVGELAIEYDDREPEDVIEWAFDTFGEDRFAIVTSFQTDGVMREEMLERGR